MTRGRAGATVAITRHGADAWLIRGTGRDINESMGRFGAAVLVDGLGYLVADEHRQAFERFAAHIGWRLIEATPATPGPAMPNPLPECWHCAQPVARNADPRHCPGCGERLRPRNTTVATDELKPHQTCRECGHTQPGRFAHCTGCGAKHTPGPALRAVPTLPADQQPGEPRPVGATLPATLDALGEPR